MARLRTEEIENPELKDWFGTIPATRTESIDGKFKSAFPKYSPPVLGKICIMALNPFKSDVVPDTEFLKEISECGFNTVCNELNSATIEETSKLLVEAGLTSIPNCEKYIFDEHHEVVDLYDCHFGGYGFLEGIKGWYFYKQPNYRQLSDKEGDFFMRWDEFRYLETNMFVMMDLAGYPEKSLMNGKTYNEYVNEFQTQFLPSLWAYDFNPIKVENGKIMVDYDTYYFDLELYSLRSKLFNRPIWGSCHCAPYLEEGVDHSIVTEASIRFEIFSALAYGAKGIKFDLYFQPEDFPSRIYYSAPINSKGDKTEIWNYVKNLNKEVKIFNNIFANSELIECMHTVNQYKGVTLYEPIFSFGPLMQIESSGIGFLMSHLFSNGIDYLVLVNHDVENAQYATLFFTEYWIINRIVMSVSGNLARLPVLRPQNGWRLEVPAGGYLIFEWR